MAFISCQTDNMEAPLSLTEIDHIEIKEPQLFADFNEDSLITPWQIELSQDNRIFVLDIQTNHVHVFDQDGNLDLSFGGRGRGPGEFIGARYLQLSEDQVYVIDIDLLRINIFNHGGDFLKAIQFDTGLFRRFVTVVDEETYFAAAMGKDGKLIRKVSTGSDSAFFFGEAMGEEYQPRDMDLERRKLQQGEIPDLFKNEITLYYSNGYLYVYLDAYSRLQKYSTEGSLVWDRPIILPVNQIIFENVVKRAQEPGPPGSVPSLQYITSMKVYDEFAYLFWVPVDNYPRQLVQTDVNGNVNLIYHIPEPEPMFSDFAISSENNLLYLIAPETGQIYRSYISDAVFK